MTRSPLIAFLLSLICLSAPCLAAEGDPEISKLRIGIDDRFKVGYWVPVEATLKGGKEQLEGLVHLIAPDGDGVPTVVTAQKPIVLIPGQETTVSLFAKIGQATADIEVVFQPRDRKPFREKFSSFDDTIPAGLDSNRSFVVTVGQPLGVVNVSADKENEDPNTRASTIYATITDASHFPTRWYGYESAEAVIICTSDIGIFRQLSPFSAQVVALDEWVRQGGQLILSVGSNAEEALGKESPLASFVPGNYTGMVSLKRTNAWETYADTTDRLDAQSIVDTEGELRLDTPKLENVRGKIEAFDGSRATDLPLVIRTPHGLGEVVFVAADLDRPPFVKWPARNTLLEKLIGKPKPKTAESQQANASSASTLGYSDLSGQLRSALEQFEGVKLVPFFVVACLILLYIVTIGPLDYLFLKRGLKRMEWTWFTFPIIVLVFNGAAYFLAYRLKGDQLLTNQVDVIDYDIESKLVRGTTWSNIFSPQVDSYNLTYKPSLPDKAPVEKQAQLMSWMGLPGEGFGGMGAPGGAGGLFSGSYSFSTELNALNRMPIAVWSTKGITNRWSGEAASPIVAELTDKGDRMLAGSILSRLDEPLTECVLVYDRWAYPIGKLDARARFSVENKLDPQTVETYFKNVSLLSPTSNASAYNPAHLDVGSIVETMMFHGHLGGNDYTKISNEYQQFIDLSGLLRCGRAMLIGRGPQAGCELQRDNQPMENAKNRRWTFYRFVFPVGQKERS